MSSAYHRAVTTDTRRMLPDDSDLRHLEDAAAVAFCHGWCPIALAIESFLAPDASPRVKRRGGQEWWDVLRD